MHDAFDLAGFIDADCRHMQSRPPLAYAPQGDVEINPFINPFIYGVVFNGVVTNPFINPFVNAVVFNGVVFNPLRNGVVIN